MRKNFTEQLEDFAIQHANLNIKTGISDWITIETLNENGLRCTGNGGDKIRANSPICKKYIIERKRKNDSCPSSKIMAIRFSGYKTESTFNQAIRSDIKKKMSKERSVWSSLNTNIEIDHKDGRKEDLRLNDRASQRFEDFQPLTKAENDYKRQKCKDCKRTDIRPSGIDEDCPFSYLGVDYTEGGQTFESDTTRCEGCWLYDLVKFRNEAFKMRLEKERMAYGRI